MEFVSVSITTHVGAIYLLLAVMAFNLYNVINIDNFIQLALKLRKMTPIFHFLNACVAYTGATVAAFTHDLSITVILMLITTILIMVLEIKRYKKMRIIKSTDIARQEEFIPYAKKIYIIEIAAVIITFVISKLF
jgi:hypothetical protein